MRSPEIKLFRGGDIVVDGSKTTTRPGCRRAVDDKSVAVRISFGNGAIATLIETCFGPSRQSDYFVDVSDSAGVWATLIGSAAFKSSIEDQIAGERRKL